MKEIESFLKIDDFKTNAFNRSNYQFHSTRVHLHSELPSDVGTMTLEKNCGGKKTSSDMIFAQNWVILLTAG